MAALRQVGKWIVRLGVLLAVLTALVLLALHMSWGRDFVRRRIVAAIQAQIDGKVTIDALDGSLLGTPTLQRLRITDARGRVVVRATSVTVDYELWPLLLGSALHLRSVAVDAPEMVLAQEGDGTWNLAHVFANTAKPPLVGPAMAAQGIRVVIDALHAEGGRLVFEGGRRATVVGIALEGNVHGGKIVVDSLTGEWEEQGRAVVIAGTLHTRGALRGFENARMQVGASSVASTRLDLERGGDLTLDLRAEDVRPFFPELPPAAETLLRMKLEPRGSGLHLVVDGNISGVGLPHALVIQGDVVHQGNDWSGVASATSPDGSIEVRGGIGVDGGRVRFDRVSIYAETSGYAQLPRWSIGKSTLAATVMGTWPEWTGEGDLKAANVVVTGTLIGPVSGHLLASDQGHSLEAVLHAGAPDAEIALDLDAKATWTSELATVRVVHARARTRRLLWKADGGEVLWRREGVTTVRSVSLASEAGRVSVEGELGGTSQLRVRLVELDFAAIGRDLSIAGLPAAGRVSGNVTIAGTAKEPDVNLAATATAVVLVPDARPVDALVHGQLHAGRARLTTRLSGSGMTVDASLAARLPDPRHIGLASIDEVRITTSSVVLADLWPTLGMHSSLVGRIGRLEATLRGRTVTLAARVEQLHPTSSPFTLDANLDATLANGAVTVHVASSDADIGEFDLTAEANAPRDLLDARAWLALRPAAIRQAELSARHIDLEAILSLVGQRPAASGHVDVQVHVPPGGLSAGVEIALQDACLSRWGACIGAAALNATLDLGFWRTLDDRVVRAMRVDVKNTDLGRLAPGAGITGALDAMLVIEPGGPLVLDATARNVITRHAKRSLGGHVHAELGDDATSVDLECTLGSEPLVRANGTLAIGRVLLRRLRTAAPLLAAAAHAEAHADALPLRLVADELGLPPTLVTKLFGTLHIDGKLDGTLGAPVLAAKLKVQKATIDKVTFEELTANAGWQGGRIDADAHARQSDGGELKLELSTGAGIVTDATLSASAFRLVALVPIVRAVGGDWLLDANGVLDATLHASGTVASPGFKGWIRVKGGRLHLRDILPPLENVNLQLTANGPHLELLASARSGTGSIALKDAQVSLEGWVPYDAKGVLETQDLRVVVAGWPVNAGIKAQFEIQHDRAAHHWGITTKLDNSAIEVLGTVSQPASFSQLEDVVLVNKSGSSGAHAQPDKVDLHLQTLPDRVVTVTYGDVRADTIVDLELEFAGGRTRISQLLQVRAGRVMVQGVPYEITDDTQLEFYRHTSTPTIHATLRHDYRNVSISIHIDGPLTRARIGLDSAPTYSQEQLMAFIMGGNPDLPDPGSTTVSTSALSALATAAFSELAPFLKRRIVVGIDEVGTEAAPTKRYSFGTWVSSKLFVNVRYRATVDITENATEGQLQWHLEHGFMIEVLGGDRAGSGDFLWIWRP